MLTKKLKVLKACLKVWNKKASNNIEVKKAEDLNQITVLDAEDNSRPLYMEKMKVRQGATKEFRKWALVEEIP